MSRTGTVCALQDLAVVWKAKRNKKKEEQVPTAKFSSIFQNQKRMWV